MTDADRRAVLTISDDEETMGRVHGAVARAGAVWDLRHASGAPEALALLAAGWIPDVALVLLAGPATDGIDVVDRLRERGAWRSIRIVILTASRAEADHDLAFAAGAAAVMVTPSSDVGYDQVVRRIGRLMDALRPSPAAPRTDIGLDLALVALAKRALGRGACMRRGDFAALVAAQCGCAAADAERRLADLIADGYLEQVGCGDDADVYAGHILSSAVIRAFTTPVPDVP